MAAGGTTTASSNKVSVRELPLQAFWGRMVKVRAIQARSHAATDKILSTLG